MHYYFDRQGNPITFAEYIEKFENKAYQIIRQDRVNGFLVSTVWLGVDHNFSMSEEHKPIIFETMVFELDGDMLGDDFEQERYHTEEEALKGHEKYFDIYSDPQNIESRREEKREDEPTTEKKERENSSGSNGRII